MKLKFNACPKCQGDLQLRRDIYGMFINCLQCGLQRDLDAPTAAVEVAQPKPELAVASLAASEELLRVA